ncbi:MAG TPA: hypothetical protein PKE54_22805, partial [Candidatus Obscuribacter sp.]|nr:hypothetical protein [Candidatus Obscuribacter sp.]
MFSTLPQSLTSLLVIDSAIAELPALPAALKSMLVEKCPNLSRLPKLPDSLQSLIIRDCAGLYPN